MIYRIRTTQQLDVLERELRPGIARIIEEAQEDKTVDQVWQELHEHLDHDSKGIWVNLTDGVVLAWMAGKIYQDEARLNACITWAWAQPKSFGRASKGIYAAVEAWARQAGAGGLWCSRRTRTKAFLRNLRRYHPAWNYEAVVFGLRFDRAKEITHGVKVCAAREQQSGRTPDGAPAVEAARDRPGERLPRPAGAAAEHGALGAAPAGDLEPPKRRARVAPRRVRKPAESGDAEPRTARSS